MEVIKNTTLCKLHKVTNGFRPMGSDADNGAQDNGVMEKLQFCSLSLGCHVRILI